MNRADPARPTLRARLSLVWKRLRGGALSPGRAAASVAVGLFVGSLPFYGVQLAIVLAVCVPLRLDAALAYVAAHASNPITLPVFIAVELEVGSLLLTGHHASIGVRAFQQAGFAVIGPQILLGSFVVGTSLSIVGAAATWIIAHGAADALQRSLTEARRRTLSRYASATRRDRTYIAIKLRTDPALRAIVKLGGHFGRVVDAGCGFAQIGLSLLDLGRATSLVGIDDDATRLAVARAAAPDDARIMQASLSSAELPEADTILFVDSLHYLPLPTQDLVLARAAAALAPSGRLLIREVSAGASLRSKLTEWMERRASRKNGRDEALFGFRSAADFCRRLAALGLTCTVLEHDELSIVHNVLIVATKAALTGARTNGNDFEGGSP